MANGIRQRPIFKRLVSHLRALNTRERLIACCFLSELVNGERICALIDHIGRLRLASPACRCASVYRHGAANGLQRYRGCSFNSLTGTPMAR